MRKTSKKMIVGILLGICMSTSTATSVHASDTVEGTSVFTSLTMGHDFASASTSWANTGGSRTVSLTYYYQFGAGSYYSVSSNTDSMNTAATTVKTKRAGSVSYGAKAKHGIKTKKTSWSKLTYTGSVPSTNKGWIKL